MRTNARTRSMLALLSVVIPVGIVLTACGDSNGSSDKQSDDSSNVTISQEPDQGDGNDDDSDNGAPCAIKTIIGEKSNNTVVEQVGTGLTKGPIAKVYTDPQGSPSDHKNLAFCQRVNVECFAPNQSGMASVNPGFYRFRIGKNTYYAIANQFTNGDVLGDASGSTSRDDKVKTCK